MSQTSIESYFATRKRPAGEDTGIIRAKKVLVLNPSTENCEINGETLNAATECIYLNKETTKISKIESCSEKELIFSPRNSVVTKLNFDSVKNTNSTMTIKKTTLTPKSKPRKIIKEVSNQPDIQTVLMKLQTAKQCKNTQEINEKTPPTTPVKNALDAVEISSSDQDLSLNQIKSKLTRSSRLAELKASIARFNKASDKVKELQKKPASVNKPEGPTLKSFKSIELEVELSPKKVSPIKPYLSPKKDVSSPRKNLLGLLSPTKNSAPAYQKFQSLVSEKASLTLPYKYRYVAEMFRSVDTVCAMLFNRKETVTFNKIKPAVQEMMRRNLTLSTFAQIKTVYPDAFELKWEKIRSFASVKEKYELVILPNIKKQDEEQVVMSPTCLLDRRRTLFNTLIERVKDYHHEFLLSLEPPMEIAREKITRWHPDFNIEQVPDIEATDLPKEPEEEKLTTGKEVLEKARNLFSCNSRMEKALEKLKELQESEKLEEKAIEAPAPPSLKGIPKALLEKIRAKQAAKALDSMTRSVNQDKEALMYSRLPEIARLMRSTFVAEKKGVLPLEECIIKLNNSYRSFLTNSEIEVHLRLLSKVVPGWLVFHEVRKTLFVKLSRDGDMSKVMSKLEQLANQKSGGS